MTSLVRSVGIAAGLLVLAGVRDASAQITEPVEFTTPFAFTAGFASLSPGSYTIRPDPDNPTVFELTGTQTSAPSVLFQTIESQAREVPSKTEVVFKRYGDKYVLKNIWLEGSGRGAETIVAEGERHASKDRAAEGEERVPGRKKGDASKNR